MDSDAGERSRHRATPDEPPSSASKGAEPPAGRTWGPSPSQTKLMLDRPPCDQPSGRTYRGFSASVGPAQARLWTALAAWLRRRMRLGAAVLLFGLSAGFALHQATLGGARRADGAAGASPPSTLLTPLAALPVPAPPPAAAGAAQAAAGPSIAARPARIARVRAPARRADPTLATLDRRLDRALAGAARAGIPAARLHAEQARWLRHRSAVARRSHAALTAYYERRIGELNARAAHAWRHGRAGRRGGLRRLS